MTGIRDETGMAILLVTHDLRVAAQVADRIAVMQLGQFVEFGSARDVIRHPEHPYTRSLIASMPGKDWDFQAFRPYSPEARADVLSPG